MIQLNENQKFKLETNGHSVSGIVEFRTVSDYPSVRLILEDNIECGIELTPQGDLRILVYRDEAVEAEVIELYNLSEPEEDHINEEDMLTYDVHIYGTQEDYDNRRPTKVIDGFTTKQHAMDEGQLWLTDHKIVKIQSADREFIEITGVS